MFHKVVWQHMQGVLGCLINTFMQIYEVILQWILAELRPWVCVATFWPTLYIQEAPILPATALLYWRSGGSASGSWLATRYMARRLSLQTPGMFKYRSRKGKYSCSKVIWTFLTPDRLALAHTAKFSDDHKESSISVPVGWTPPSILF